LLQTLFLFDFQSILSTFTTVHKLCVVDAVFLDVVLKTLVEQQDDYIKKLETVLQKYDESLSNLRKALSAKNKLVSDQAFKIDQLKRKLRRRR
jgi:peptidoglycan hydrolase CwlO-like protein